VLLDHGDRGSAVLGDELQIKAFGERHADEGVVGGVELPWADLGPRQRTAPVILRPLALLDRSAVLRIDEDVGVLGGVQR